MNRIVFVVLLLAAGGCAGGPKHVVPDAELAVLGGKGLEGVDAARAEEAAARKALETRRAEQVVAQREVRIAEFAIRRDEADLEVARLQFEGVQETHEADAMLPANARRGKAAHAVETSRAELTYRRAALRHAGTRIDEAEAAVRLSLAKLERAKLEAVLGGETNLQPAQAQRKAAFDVQLSDAQAALAARSAEVVKTEGAMQAAESEWKAVAARE